MEEKDGYKMQELFEKLASYVPEEGKEMKYLYDVSDIMQYYENFWGPDAESVIYSMVNRAIE